MNLLDSDFCVVESMKHQDTCLHRFLFYYSPTLLFDAYDVGTLIEVNPLSTNPTEWSDTLK